MIYITADNHFGHTNVIKYCKRPFSSVEEMDEVMIERWNSKVKRNDTVYHLGDFTLFGSKRALEYFSKLNGQIYIITNWNHHDKNWIGKIVGRPEGMYQNTIYESKSLHHVRLIDTISYPLGLGKYIVMCHYPIEEWDRKHYGSIHLHGHSHGNSRKIPNRYDVGVDCWDFYPVTLEEILEAQ